MKKRHGRTPAKLLAPYVVLIALIINGPSGSCSTVSSDQLRHAPRTVLWAWQREERLDCISPARLAVAFLAKTIRLRDNEIIVQPRVQPLRVPRGTYLEAVVRLDTETLHPVRLDESGVHQLLREIESVAKLKQVKCLQVDFDARANERIFYRRLLTDLRARLPDSCALSITALASPRRAMVDQVVGRCRDGRCRGGRCRDGDLARARGRRRRVCPPRPGRRRSPPRREAPRGGRDATPPCERAPAWAIRAR